MLAARGPSYDNATLSMELCSQVTRALEAKIEHLTEEGKGFKLHAEGQVTLKQISNIAPDIISVTCPHVSLLPHLLIRICQSMPDPKDPA